MGRANVPSQMPEPASRLYAQNVVNLLTLMTTAGEKGEDGTVSAATFTPDFDDEIVAGCCVTHDGRILHEPTREAIEGPTRRPSPTASPEATAGTVHETPAADARFDQEADQ